MFGPFKDMKEIFDFKLLLTRPITQEEITELINRECEICDKFGVYACYNDQTLCENCYKFELCYTEYYDVDD